MIGVFRSCDIAVRMRVRSAMKRDRRRCMVLNARAACCTSIGPFSAAAARLMSSPRFSAASPARAAAGHPAHRDERQHQHGHSRTASVSASAHGRPVAPAAASGRRSPRWPSRSCTCVSSRMPPGPGPPTAHATAPGRHHHRVAPGPGPAGRDPRPPCGARPATCTFASSPSAARSIAVNIECVDPGVHLGRPRSAAGGRATPPAAAH